MAGERGGYDGPTAGRVVVSRVGDAPANAPMPKSRPIPPAYTAAAVKNECERLRRTPNEEQARRSAYALGRFVGAGVLEYHDALAQLHGAAGGKHIALIGDGLDAGSRRPVRLTA